MTYKVKYEGNYEDDSYETYNSIEEAEKSIQEELDGIIPEYEEDGEDSYDYGTENNEYGNLTTEIFQLGGGRYDRWIRMWKREV